MSSLAPYSHFMVLLIAIKSLILSLSKVFACHVSHLAGCPVLEHLKSYIQEIPDLAIKTRQAVESTITKIGCNNHIQNIRKSYRTAALAITIVTKRMDRNGHTDQHQITKKIHKTLHAHENSTSTIDCTSCTHSGPAVINMTSTTSRNTVSEVFAKTKRTHGNTRTQNSK